MTRGTDEYAHRHEAELLKKLRKEVCYVLYLIYPVQGRYRVLSDPGQEG
jgi:hypothetical protein